MVTDDSGERSASVLMVKLAKRKEALRSETLVAIYKSTPEDLYLISFMSSEW